MRNLSTQRYVVANWKMNLPPLPIVDFIASLPSIPSSDATKLILAPPFPFINEVITAASNAASSIEVAGQNCSEKENGPLTGEVSASMLMRAGATYVIIGHSERRALFREGDDIVAEKIAACWRSGPVPILCIGEPIEVRDEGDVRGYLEKQIQSSVPSSEAGSLLVAYEPVWAIGSGRNASASMIAEAVGWIRSSLDKDAGRGRSPVIYGGSVTAENVDELQSDGGIDGFLVGGASLDPEALSVIYQSTAGRALPDSGIARFREK